VKEDELEKQFKKEEKFEDKREKFEIEI